jgi:hypothetical protein
MRNVKPVKLLGCKNTYGVLLTDWCTAGPGLSPPLCDFMWSMYWGHAPAGKGGQGDLVRAASRQPPNLTWGGHVQAYVTVVYQMHALQNVRHLYPCLLQPMGALFNKRFVIVLLPFSYVFITVFIYLFYFNFNFFFICFWRTSGSVFVIFSSVAPHRAQPAAKCHPRWQPTKRLAVNCWLGRRRCPLQVKNIAVPRLQLRIYHWTQLCITYGWVTPWVRT